MFGTKYTNRKLTWDFHRDSHLHPLHLASLLSEITNLKGTILLHCSVIIHHGWSLCFLWCFWESWRLFLALHRKQEKDRWQHRYKERKTSPTAIYLSVEIKDFQPDGVQVGPKTHTYRYELLIYSKWKNKTQDLVWCKAVVVGSEMYYSGKKKYFELPEFMHKSVWKFCHVYLGYNSEHKM